MSASSYLTRHNIYLADSVWQVLRQRAVAERSSANKIIVDLLRAFAADPSALPPGRYKARLAETALDAAKGRTIRLPPEISARVMQIVEDRTSLACLVDVLLRQYLVVELGGESPPASQRVKVGKTEFDLGEHPFTLDMNSGEVQGRKAE
jgi:hypothetical protein